LNVIGKPTETGLVFFIEWWLENGGIEKLIMAEKVQLSFSLEFSLKFMQNSLKKVIFITNFITN
jgi:hypothetical protein